VDQPFANLCGWRGVDAIQKTFAAQFPDLRQTAPRLFGAPVSTQSVLLYKAFFDALGPDWPGYKSQEIGDCCGHGHGHANDLLQCIAISLGQLDTFRETDTEFVYGASRETAGILNSPGDGSYGAATVKAMTQMGMISRQMMGDQGPYSGARAKEWGRLGPPDEAKEKAAHFKLGAAALCSTWDDYVRAIQNGYPVTVCSQKGFSLERDAQGFCREEGRWGHCMFFAGVRFDRPGGLCCQSWGAMVPRGPLVMGQPDWSFWIDQPTVEAMLAEGDSWALSNTPSFDPQKLPRAWTYGVAA